jgi:hypothetical protein
MPTTVKPPIKEHQVFFHQTGINTFLVHGFPVERAFATRHVVHGYGNPSRLGADCS